MTRIVGGVAGGRPIAAPPGSSTRPTSDRAREALFSTLATVLDLPGGRVLDLYAGSGALGLEALSRGAATALFVEEAPAALRVLRTNVATLALPGARVRAGRVERVLAAGPGGEPGAGPELPTRYDVVLADPPYATSDDALSGMLTALVERRWLSEVAVVVVERSSRAAPLSWPAGISALRHRHYGEATLWYGRAAPPAGPPSGPTTSRMDRIDAR